MPTQLDEILEYLKKVDEVLLLELLDLNSEDILARFEDRVCERRDYIERELELFDSSSTLSNDDPYEGEEELDFND